MMIGATEIGRMKPGAILVNTAHGRNISGKQFDSLDDLGDQDLLDLMKHYPNVLVTPHMGCFTEPATEDMIRISFDNFHDAITTGATKNQVK